MKGDDRLLKWAYELSKSLSALVSRYGIAEALIFEGVPPAIAMSDFFLYCVTKGTKHIRAAVVLVENGFSEDAIVLSRAAYECYISAAYATAHGPRAIDDLVYNVVGLSAKTVEYARTAKGRWDFRRLVDKTTGTFYDAPPSIQKMVQNTGYAADAIVHKYYYSFSSEHAHVNMAGSGNYREGGLYTDQGNSQKHNAIFFTAYISVLLSSITIARTDVEEHEKARVCREIGFARKQISKTLDKYSEDPTGEFAHAVRARLNDVVIQ